MALGGMSLLFFILVFCDIPQAFSQQAQTVHGARQGRQTDKRQTDNSKHWSQVGLCEALHYPCLVGTVLPHPDDCRLYLQCVFPGIGVYGTSNNWIVRSCSDGTWFDRNQLFCVLPTDVECAEKCDITAASKKDEAEEKATKVADGLDVDDESPTETFVEGPKPLILEGATIPLNESHYAVALRHYEHSSSEFDPKDMSKSLSDYRILTPESLATNTDIISRALSGMQKMGFPGMHRPNPGLPNSPSRTELRQQSHEFNSRGLPEIPNSRTPATGGGPSETANRRPLPKTLPAGFGMPSPMSGENDFGHNGFAPHNHEGPEFRVVPQNVGYSSKVGGVNQRMLHPPSPHQKMGQFPSQNEGFSSNIHAPKENSPNPGFATNAGNVNSGFVQKPQQQPSFSFQPKENNMHRSQFAPSFPRTNGETSFRNPPNQNGNQGHQFIPREIQSIRSVDNTHNVNQGKKSLFTNSQQGPGLTGNGGDQFWWEGLGINPPKSNTQFRGYNGNYQGNTDRVMNSNQQQPIGGFHENNHGHHHHVPNVNQQAPNTGYNRNIQGQHNSAMNNNQRAPGFGQVHNGNVHKMPLQPTDNNNFRNPMGRPDQSTFRSGFNGNLGLSRRPGPTQGQRQTHQFVPARQRPIDPTLHNSKRVPDSSSPRTKPEGKNIETKQIESFTGDSGDSVSQRGSPSGKGVPDWEPPSSKSHPGSNHQENGDKNPKQDADKNGGTDGVVMTTILPKSRMPWDTFYKMLKKYSTKEGQRNGTKKERQDQDPPIMEEVVQPTKAIAESEVSASQLAIQKEPEGENLSTEEGKERQAKKDIEHKKLKPKEMEQHRPLKSEDKSSTTFKKTARKKLSSKEESNKSAETLQARKHVVANSKDKPDTTTTTRPVALGSDSPSSKPTSDPRERTAESTTWMHAYSTSTSDSEDSDNGKPWYHRFPRLDVKNEKSPKSLESSNSRLDSLDELDKSTVKELSTSDIKKEVTVIDTRNEHKERIAEKTKDASDKEIEEAVAMLAKASTSTTTASSTISASSETPSKADTIRNLYKYLRRRLRIKGYRTRLRAKVVSPSSSGNDDSRQNTTDLEPTTDPKVGSSQAPTNTPQGRSVQQFSSTTPYPQTTTYEDPWYPSTLPSPQMEISTINPDPKGDNQPNEKTRSDSSDATSVDAESEFIEMNKSSENGDQSGYSKEDNEDFYSPGSESEKIKEDLHSGELQTKVAPQSKKDKSLSVKYGHLYLKPLKNQTDSYKMVYTSDESTREAYISKTVTTLKPRRVDPKPPASPAETTDSTQAQTSEAYRHEGVEHKMLIPHKMEELFEHVYPPSHKDFLKPGLERWTTGSSISSKTTITPSSGVVKGISNVYRKSTKKSTTKRIVPQLVPSVLKTNVSAVGLHPTGDTLGFAPEMRKKQNMITPSTKSTGEKPRKLTEPDLSHLGKTTEKMVISPTKYNLTQTSEKNGKQESPVTTVNPLPVTETGLPVGIIIGVSVVGILLLAIIAVPCIFCRVYKNHRKHLRDRYLDHADLTTLASYGTTDRTFTNTTMTSLGSSRPTLRTPNWINKMTLFNKLQRKAVSDHCLVNLCNDIHHVSTEDLCSCHEGRICHITGQCRAKSLDRKSRRKRHKSRDAVTSFAEDTAFHLRRPKLIGQSIMNPSVI